MQGEKLQGAQISLKIAAISLAGMDIFL